MARHLLRPALNHYIHRVLFGASAPLELVSGAMWDMIAQIPYLWQDYALESNPVTADGQDVGAWSESIGDLLQVAYSTVGYDGIYIANSNGYPAVRMADDSKYRGISGNELDEPGGARTYHFVVSSSDAGVNSLFQHATTAQTSARFDVNNGAGAPKIVFGSTPVTTFNTSAKISDGAIHVWTVTFYNHATTDMDKHTCRIDGNDLGIASYTNGGTLVGWNEIFLGGDSAGSNMFNGDVHRVLAYNSVLSLADQKQNEAALGALYGVAITP